jgi:hypothetical protein
LDGGNYFAEEGPIRWSFYYNNQLLFKDFMEYGAEGPIMDARIVNGKPAFSYRKNLDGGSDIFYDGKFISKEYNVHNPRYLFSYKGKIGFVAQDGESQRIFYNGAFITSEFDQIHTHNCCALMEIKPAVYENGVLLFYGRRANQDYLVEVKLL